MKKRRFRQIRLATNAEIAAIASPALAERMFVDIDNNQLYYIDESGAPRSIQGTGSGATNLAVANNTATALDVTSDTGTDATIPAAVADTTAGLMTAADKTKLDGVAKGATANSSDGQLISRTNHTGTQTASTISDFDTEVSNNTSVTANTAKVSADGSLNTHSDVDDTGKSNGDVLRYNSSSLDWEPDDGLSKIEGFSMFSGRSVTGVTGITTSTKLDLSTTIINTGGFTHDTANDEVDITKSGSNLYLMLFHATFNDSLSAVRSEVNAWLESWDGASWILVPESQGSCYLRGTGQAQTISGHALRYWTGGTNIIRVMASVTGTSTDVFQVNNKTGLIIQQFK